MTKEEQAIWEKGIAIAGLFTLAVVVSGIPAIGDLMVGILILVVIVMFLNSPIPDMIGRL